MKTSPYSKTQSKSLKKEIRAAASACENSKSMEKKPFHQNQLITNLAFSIEGPSQCFIPDLEIKETDKIMTEKCRHKVSKEKDRQIKRKPPGTPVNKKVKNFIGSKLQKRLQSYYLFLLLCRYTLNLPKCKNLGEQQKYTVYIGKGNNSKLMKKLFYSRHWWNITNDPKCEKINLIWTQWSKKTIFSLLQQQPGPQIFVHMANRIVCQQQPKKSLMFNQYNFLLRNKQRDSSKSSFVETENQVKNYLNSLRDVKQKKKKTINITCNHVEGHETITDKKNLFFSLQSYCNSNNQSCFDIVPLTFHISGTNEQLTNLQSVEKQLHQEDKRTMWICKPGQKSNRGNGIKVFKKVHQIKEHLQKQSEKHPQRTYIIQKYIFPALFHRRKFDIRCFVLLISSPHISAYFYDDGYLRTSSKQFKDKKFDDKFIHLTNDAIQKKATDYGKFEKGNKVTFEEYQEFLDMFEKKDIHFRKDIVPKLKVMAAKSIAAGCSKFNESKKSYSFELLGYDFMLDQSYKPWLIQVNTNPCIETGCPVLQSFIPSAVNNALKIAVDSVFKPPKVNDWHLQQVITFPEKILEPNKYQLIFKQVLS